MKRKEQRKAPLKRKGNRPIGKSLFICFMLMFITLTNEFSCVNFSEGKVNEESTINFAYGESCFRMIIAEEIAYLYLTNVTDDPYVINHYIDIINLESIQTPVKLGRYTLQQIKYALKIEVRDHLLYVLSIVPASVQTLALTIINVTDPSHPWEVGKYQEGNVSTPHDFTVYKDHCYLCTETEMKIIGLSNKTEPNLIIEYPIPAFYVEMGEEILYLCRHSLQAYNITNPEQPTLLGEITEGKGSLVAVEIEKNFVYTGFLWDGATTYDFRDPENPSILGDYSFPKREIQSGGQIRDIAISGNRLFACGYGLYIFGIGTPRWIRRIAHRSIDAYAYEIAEENGYLFFNTWDSIKIYSYKDYTVAISLGVTSIVVIPIIVFFAIRYRKQKKKKVVNR